MSPSRKDVTDQLHDVSPDESLGTRHKRESILRLPALRFKPKPKSKKLRKRIRSPQSLILTPPVTPPIPLVSSKTGQRVSPVGSIVPPADQVVKMINQRLDHGDKLDLSSDEEDGSCEERSVFGEIVINPMFTRRPLSQYTLLQPESATLSGDEPMDISSDDTPIDSVARTSLENAVCNSSFAPTHTACSPCFSEDADACDEEIARVFLLASSSGDDTEEECSSPLPWSGRTNHPGWYSDHSSVSTEVPSPASRGRTNHPGWYPDQTWPRTHAVSPASSGRANHSAGWHSDSQLTRFQTISPTSSGRTIHPGWHSDPQLARLQAISPSSSGRTNHSVWHGDPRLARLQAINQASSGRPIHPHWHSDPQLARLQTTSPASSGQASNLGWYNDPHFARLQTTSPPWSGPLYRNDVLQNSCPTDFLFQREQSSKLVCNGNNLHGGFAERWGRVVERMDQDAEFRTDLGRQGACKLTTPMIHASSKRSKVTLHDWNKNALSMQHATMFPSSPSPPVMASCCCNCLQRFESGDFVLVPRQNYGPR